MRYLYNKYPKATSHQLALPKAKAICAPALASLAVRRLGLHKIMLVNSLDLTEAINAYVPLLQASSGEEIVQRGWKYDPPKALSDVFESVMGAILVDSAYNYEKASAVIEHVMEDVLIALSPSVVQDPVSVLVEWIAAAGCSRLSFE
jgi:endoribonuclease Dicer